MASAVFCENIVEGADKTISAIRIIDRVTIVMPTEIPADVSSEEFKIPLMIRALISFRTGYAKRRHDLHLTLHSPGGNKQIGPKQRVVLGKEPNSGANLNIAFTILVNKSGLFWFDVFLDGKVVTRMPLDVIVEKAQQKPQSKAIKKAAKKKKP